MIKIRLQRLGRKCDARYAIIIADARAPRDGRFIEKIGHYNPHSSPNTAYLKIDRLFYWMGVGAQPTRIMRDICRAAGVLVARHLAEGIRKGAISHQIAQRRFSLWQKKREAQSSPTWSIQASGSVDAILNAGPAVAAPAA